MGERPAAIEPAGRYAGSDRCGRAARLNRLNHPVRLPSIDDCSNGAVVRRTTPPTADVIPVREEKHSCSKRI
ncbi:hypothetical protein ACG33_02075 [Steroidobacter denitrificans]|uniref:Uncharacterized protein n=1 Tax=Steroidobacter denitrificans TaxID=465721 RepID=A0A127F643_STEDE|nr:hypothetical protein ACG33_02075 [Steroidobacter denitrificans]